MIGKGLEKRKTQGIRGIKAGGGDQPGFSSVPGRGRGPSVVWPREPRSCPSPLAFSTHLSQGSDPQYPGKCSREPAGESQGLEDASVSSVPLSPYCVWQAIPPQSKIGLPCGSWVSGNFPLRRPFAPTPSGSCWPWTCRRSSGRLGALGARGWRCEAGPRGWEPAGRG